MCRLWPLLCFLASPLWAQNPVLHRVSPLGLPAGRTTDVTLIGERLEAISSAWTSLPGVQVTVSNNSILVVTAPADAAGIAALRVATTNGASELVYYVIDELHSVTDPGTNNSPETAYHVRPPIAVDATTRDLSFDYYGFRAKKGETVSIEVLASRIGSKLDPVLRVLDADRRELAFCEDAPGAGRDCRLQFRAPATAEYLVEVRDIAYGGGPQFYYHIRFGRFAFPTCTYPLAAQARTEVKVLGPRSEHFKSDVVCVNTGPGYASVDGNFVATRLHDAFADFEHEPNDNRERANSISLSSTLNGRFEKTGDVDWFQFDAEKDQRWIFRSFSRGLGSPCDVFLSIHDAAGKEIATANVGGPQDASLTNTFKESGRYFLALKELADRGAPDLVYQVAIQKFDPGFSLFVDDDKVEAKTGGEVTLSVSCLRYEFSDKIDLSLPGLPDGVTVENSVIEAKKTNAVVKIKVSDAVAPGALITFNVAGKAGDASAIATTQPALLRSFHLMLHPPATLDGVVSLGVTSGAPVPEPKRRGR